MVNDKKLVAGSPYGIVYFNGLERLRALASRAPPIKPPFIPFMPKIIYDGRPEVGSFDFTSRFMPGTNPPTTSSHIFTGEVILDVKNTSFYHPAFPRKIAPEFIRHQTGQCGEAVDYADFQFGDDKDVTNNHKAFDKDFTFGPLSTYYDAQTGKPIKSKVTIGGAQGFSAGNCAPVFHKRADYPGFFVDEFYYYRAFNAGWGAMTDGFQHEHDYQIAMVWVNKTTGKPFHFAVRYHAVPFVGDIWMQKDVRDASELTAYGELRSGELRLSKHPWANGEGAVIGPRQKYINIGALSAGEFIYPIESIINDSDIDAADHLKTKEHHGILNKTSPPAMAPWKMPTFRDPDKIRTQQMPTYFMSYFKLGSPAEMSFVLDGKTSDKNSWMIPQSAIDGKVGYVINGTPKEPKVRLVGTGNGVLDLDGYLVGIGGSNRFVNFSLANIPIKTGETIEITPDWSAVETGSTKALNYFVNINGKPIAFQSAATISGAQFEAALNEAINKSKAPTAPQNHPTNSNQTAKPATLDNQSLLQYVSLGAIVGGTAMLGAGAWMWRQDRKAAGIEVPYQKPTRSATQLPPLVHRTWTPPKIRPLLPEPQPADARLATEFSREELLSRRERVIEAFKSGRISYELMTQQVAEIDRMQIE